MKTFLIKFCVIFLILGIRVPLMAQTQLTNLPTMYITTDDGKSPASKETYQKGRIIIKSSVSSENLDMVTEIRGRGNSTWGFEKKPYRIKLDKKTRLLGLPANAKSWVLLANHADKTLMRNAIAFKISELLGFEFTPSVRFVDVVLNGKYIGNYMVTDQIEVADKRVPVEEDGGYFLEVDGFASGEPVWFSTSKKNMPVTIKYPKDDEITSQQISYIKNFTQQFEDALFSSNFTNAQTGYRAFIDERSLINWYIACELTGNSDSFWSTYIYKYKTSNKFYFGPLWDFDIAFNNDNRLGDATKKLMRDSAHDPKAWIKRLWEDPWFKKAVNDRWKELLAGNITSTLVNYANGLATTLNASQTKNFQTWNVLNKRVHFEYSLFTTYQAGVDFLTKYISDRAAFLTTSFASTAPAAPASPFVAENYYYSIANKNTNNLITVANSATTENTVLELRSLLSGNNYNQQWSFVSLGGDLFMIVNRNSGLAIAGNGISKNLIQVKSNSADKKQQWHIVPVADGLYGLINESSKYSINNSNGSSANGTPCIEYTERIKESANQQWFIKKGESKTPPVESTPAFVAENYYYSIANKNTSNLVTVANNATTENAVLELRSLLSGNNYNQQWSFVPLGGDIFMIVNRNSGLAIAGNGISKNMIQVKANSADKKQQWHIVPVAGNVYGLINESSKYSANNSGGSATNGTPFIEYTERITESANQQWFIRKGESKTTGGGSTPGDLDLNSKDLPVLSSDDASNETWYYIRFKNGGHVIQDMGENVNVLTKDLNENEPAQLWKFVAVANPTGDYKYVIKSKSGRTISHVSSSETGDGFFQTTKNTATMSKFSIVATTNSTYTPAWELYRQGASNRRVNQYQNTNVNARISEWTANDGNNPLVFVKAKVIGGGTTGPNPNDKLPAVSTSANPYWYYIQTQGGSDGRVNLVFTADNDGVRIFGKTMLTSGSASEIDKQLWRFEKSGSNYTIINKATGKKLSTSYNSSKGISVTALNASSSTTWQFESSIDNYFNLKASAAPSGGSTSAVYTHQANNYDSRNFVIMMESSSYNNTENSRFRFVLYQGAGTPEKASEIEPSNDSKLAWQFIKRTPQLLAYTGIDDLAPDNKTLIYVRDRQIIVEGTDKYTIRTIQGMLVERQKSQLPVGVYLVTVNGKTTKVLVH